MSSLDSRLLRGVPQEKKKIGGVTGIGLHAVSMSSLDSRLLWGGVPQEEKVGGVTGIGLHAVSMSSLDSRLLWGVPQEKKSAESPESDFTPFPHHSSAEDN
ncbi:hypothetical protein TNCV_672051 [Trichonephila clavipes]|nr:hypothetical protein TNCV_672051 [Trichonephila clavipes]